MPKRAYDDKEFMQQTEELRRVIFDMLEVEGNTPETVQQEIDNIMDSYEDEDEDDD